MLLSSWDFGLNSSKRNLPAQARLSDGQQIAKTSFKLFNFYSYIIFSVSFCDESRDGEESSETEGNGGTASNPELLSSSDSEHDSEVDESDSLEMGSFIEHSSKVLYEPDAEVECITVCDKKVN